jgi:hypothetical protein
MLCFIACDNIECSKLTIFEADEKIPYKKCSQCKYEYYCSTDCQLIAWNKYHKTVCKSLSSCVYGDYITYVKTKVSCSSDEKGILYSLFNANLEDLSHPKLNTQKIKFEQLITLSENLDKY